MVSLKFIRFPWKSVSGSFSGRLWKIRNQNLKNQNGRSNMAAVVEELTGMLKFLIMPKINFFPWKDRYVEIFQVTDNEWSSVGFQNFLNIFHFYFYHYSNMIVWIRHFEFYLIYYQISSQKFEIYICVLVDYLREDLPRVDAFGNDNHSWIANVRTYYQHSSSVIETMRQSWWRHDAFTARRNDR